RPGVPPAAELAGLPRPLIIYAGSTRAYLNVGLVRGTADRLREASFVFVGPAAAFLAPLVPGLRNVAVVGPLPARGAPGPAGLGPAQRARDRPPAVPAAARLPGRGRRGHRPPPGGPGDQGGRAREAVRLPGRRPAGGHQRGGRGRGAAPSRLGVLET